MTSPTTGTAPILRPLTALVSPAARAGPAARGRDDAPASSSTSSRVSRGEAAETTRTPAAARVPWGVELAGTLGDECLKRSCGPRRPSGCRRSQWLAQAGTCRRADPTPPRVHRGDPVAVRWPGRRARPPRALRPRLPAHPARTTRWGPGTRAYGHVGAGGSLGSTIPTPMSSSPTSATAAGPAAGRPIATAGCSTPWRQCFETSSGANAREVGGRPDWTRRPINE